MGKTVRSGGGLFQLLAGGAHLGGLDRLEPEQAGQQDQHAAFQHHEAKRAEQHDGPVLDDQVQRNRHADGQEQHGNSANGPETFVYDVVFPERDEDDPTVAHMWAQRRVADLLTELRLEGVRDSLVEEIVEVANQFGIVTPYTAKTKVIDSLPQLGGQLAALYPDKYIYDIPGFPKVLAKDLVARQVEQALQFSPAICRNIADASEFDRWPSRPETRCLRCQG